ncbi:MAG: methionyl-tRNA formyltransferase [Acidobacteriota bacterium]
MKIVFMGTPQAAVPSLERLIADGHEVVAVYTQPDRPSGRGNKITFSPVKEFALANRLTVYQPVKIKTPEALEDFISHEADVAVVVAYGRILPETFLNAFPHGAINVHFSLLPKYRGAAPVNWAIVNGETETGVTTMRMDAGLDTGDILVQQAAPIDSEQTAIDLMTKLSFIGAELLSETLSHLDTIELKPQDHTAATLAPIMKREDGIIDWQMSAKEISDRVRGFQPFPSAFTYFQKGKLTIWRAFPAVIDDTAIVDTAPGEIVEAHGDELLIKCGVDSILSVSEIQPEGKRRMQVRDFLNGSKPQKGMAFGA